MSIRRRHRNQAAASAMQWLFLSVLLVTVGARTHAQQLSSDYGNLYYVRVGIPTTLLPVPSGDTTVTPYGIPTDGYAPRFTIQGEPGKEYLVWCASSIDLWCGSAQVSFRPDAMYWLEGNRRLDPNTPQTVRCDSVGVATLNVGLTVEFSPETRASGAETWITCFVADPALGDTAAIGARIDIWYLVGKSYDLDGNLTRAVRGTTYTVDPGEGTASVTPVRSGRETASFARVAVEGIGEEDVQVTWLLPTSLRDDSDRTIPVTFNSTAGRIAGTGARFNPNVPDTVHIGANCGVTLDIGFTVTVPEGATHGAYTGAIIGTAVYIGNASAPRAISTFETEHLITVDVSADGIPGGYVLAQNYPNPFNAGTVFSFFLPRSEEVTLTVVDLLGRTVATVLENNQTAGWHEAHWQAEGLSSGVYFYRLQVGDVTQTRKLLYLR